jgi:hypothetical protein
MTHHVSVRKADECLTARSPSSRADTHESVVAYELHVIETQDSTGQTLNIGSGMGLGPTE